MPWVRFTEDHDFTPAANRRTTLAYKAGTIDNVTRECAEQAIGLGRAVAVKKPATREEASAARDGRDAAVMAGGGDGVDAA
ncbi:hypothetical protein [uncultured Caulobacter sp.]|uniref:hypothetical protein n=1 Tax=uncultured Caulobacter sp. TaxID=158749 RepID=UPI0026318B15|nr:hypothetical protein [uncultured Caulobacter sp.]